MTLEDVRDEVARLSTRVGLQGQSLIDAIECGSTGTESHMALQYHLRRVSEIQQLNQSLKAAGYQLALEVTKAVGFVAQHRTGQVVSKLRLVFELSAEP